MKTIAESVSLAGQHETITISELRSQPGEVFAQVTMGKSFTVTKTGAPVAVITQPPEEFDWKALSWLRKIPA